MSTPLQETEPRATEPQSFVETALTLGGKSEEEARKTGSLDRADEQVEALFAPRYQTTQSPVHRAVWDREFPSNLFWSTSPSTPPDCERTMEASLDVVRRHRAGERSSTRRARSPIRSSASWPGWATGACSSIANSAARACHSRRSHGS